MGDTIVSGQNFTTSLTSQSGKYTTIIQQDGNLVTYQNVNGIPTIPTWASGSQRGYPFDTEVDFRETRLFLFRSTTNPNFIQCLMFMSDPFAISQNTNLTTQAQQVLQSLDYMDMNGATGVFRSGFGPYDMWFAMHARQNLGGHTTADKGSFLLCSLGRMWVKEQFNAANNAPTFHNIVQIDGMSMPLTTTNGDVHAQPCKLAGYQSNLYATFMSVDVTFGYNYVWQFVTFPVGSTFTPNSGNWSAMHTHSLSYHLVM